MRFGAIFKLRGGGRSKNESKVSVIQSTVSEYVRKSTIHGVAYVGDDERNKFERIWWLVMLVCSVFGACYLIYQAYRTMKENPIIESPSLTRIPLWEIPFPAVTFCPVAEFEFSSFALNRTNWPDFARNLLPTNLTDLAINEVFYSSWFIVTMVLRRSGQNNYDILRQFLPELGIEFANFGSFPTQVGVSFQKTITEYGPCLTFNMYQEKDILRNGVILSALDYATVETERLWSRDSGFNNDLPLANYTYPFRSFGPGDSLAMTFNVTDFKRFSQFNSVYTAVFHAPDEVPLFGRHSESVTIDPGQITDIELTPHVVVSEGIAHYAPEVRKCYYSDERHLKFYKNYTQNHCEMECLANHFLAQCGCVSYHLPHFTDAKLCTTIADFECLIHKIPQFYLPNFKGDAGRAPIDNCNCLPSCTQLSYEPVRKSIVRSFDENKTSVVITNKYPQFKKQIRSELHSISEFFSNCGGSLGLFLGVSIFSIVELIYFCTVRLYLHSKVRPADSNK